MTFRIYTCSAGKLRTQRIQSPDLGTKLDVTLSSIHCNSMGVGKLIPNMNNTNCKTYHVSSWSGAFRLFVYSSIYWSWQEDAQCAMWDSDDSETLLQYCRLKFEYKFHWALMNLAQLLLTFFCFTTCTKPLERLERSSWSYRGLHGTLRITWLWL